MKKTFTFLVALFMTVVGASAQTTINFDTDGNWTASGSLTSYANHSYSESGITVQGTNVIRNGTSTQDGFAGALGTYSMRLRNAVGSKALITVSTGGVGEFSLKVRRWDGSPIPDYTVKFSTDGGTNWADLTNITGTLLTTSDWFTYSGTVNNASDNIQIEIANTGTTERIMIDDITINGYTGGATTPSIASSSSSLTGFDYVTTPGGPSAEQMVTVSGTNLTDDITIAASANYEISFTSGASFTSSTLTVTQAQAVIGKDLYIRLKAGLSADTYTENVVLSTTDGSDKNIVCSGVVSDPEVAKTTTIPYVEDFTTDFGDCYTYSVAGETKVWSISSDMASANGYLGSNPEEDWLILPGINLNSYVRELMTFTTTSQYGINDANNYLKLYYSTDYPGVGDPSSSTWTEIAYTQPVVSSSETSASSGNVDLSGISGTAVYIAFKYFSTDNPTSWKVDDISIVEGPEGVSISVDPISLSTLNYEVDNGPSVSKTIVVSGLNLTSEITVSAPADFEVSLDDAAYSSSVATPMSGEATTVYVRLATGKTIGVYSGNITLSSTDATDVLVELGGEVTAPVIVPNAWINEIHYDNDGGDVGELVEIVVQNVGTYSVSDFTITLYNGSNGTVYDTKNGADFAYANGGDYRFYVCAIVMQNGAPDGIALSYAGTLIQFLSYEGSFIAVGGVADGVSSTDIGVSEIGTTPIGQSLQLFGSGAEYSDFVWVAPATATTGYINNGQSFGGATWTGNKNIDQDITAKAFGVKSAIVIRSTEIANYSVFNLAGKLVNHGKVTNGELKLNAAPGIYMVTLNNQAHKVLVK